MAPSDTDIFNYFCMQMARFGVRYFTHCFSLQVYLCRRQMNRCEKTTARLRVFTAQLLEGADNGGLETPNVKLMQTGYVDED